MYTMLVRSWLHAGRISQSCRLAVAAALAGAGQSPTGIL
jgi:hypothetical protein